MDLISDVTSSLTGHDIICDDFPEEMYGKGIGDVIMELRRGKGITKPFGDSVTPKSGSY